MRGPDADSPLSHDGPLRRRRRRARSTLLAGDDGLVGDRDVAGLASAADRRLTRRRLLAAGATTTAAAAFGLTFELSSSRGRSAVFEQLAAPRARAFLSRPDLRIPTLTVSAYGEPVAPGLIFFAPSNAPNGAQAGAVIADNNGELIWEQPLPHTETMDFRVQTYKGRPALTWWQGYITLGHGVGHYVIADTSYRTLATPNAGNGLQGDLHEFLLTDRGTALLTSYLVTHADLRPVGGSADGTIQDAIFQELDIATGRVLLDWHSLDHIALSESYWPVGENWDYVHLNSIAVDQDEDLLVSSRSAHTIYKLDRASGQVIWRLGGKHSDFAIAPDAVFAWQHDARRQPDGTITVFDNGNKISRALVLNVDEPNRRVTLQRAYTHPANLHADSQGNVQVLPNGNIFVGWGAQPYISEFTPDGELALDARLASDDISYRAYRVPWTGEAPGLPAVATRRSGSHTDVYVSWNGDTRVTRWTALAGTTPTNLVPTASVPRRGFETTMRIPRACTHLRVQGNDATGQPLATTNSITI